MPHEPYPQRWGHFRLNQVVVAHNDAERLALQRRGFMPDWHRRSPFGWEYCDAGFRAFLEGAWHRGAACRNRGTNYVGSDLRVAAPLLCDEHFAQASAAGFVAEPNIGEKVYRVRYGDR